jgi:Fic/DOC family
MALSSHSDIYKEIVASNQLRMMDLLKDSVMLTIENPSFFNQNMIFALHHAAMSFLLDEPAKYRRHDVSITYSDHIPPPAKDVPSLMLETIQTIRETLMQPEPDAMNHIIIASYALWRINWIHPFEDGNGRLSRAICYLIINVGFRGWFKSKRNIPDIISHKEIEYQKLLRDTDLSLENSNLDLIPLTKFVFNCLYEQLEAQNA